ncbi:uncharacterized protein BKA78DRAFT_354164 [Phyllosticta capitalensis]|uniref:uncharacterized protein n=1 Tax=Phyllosticta capitalensis TaxID=121624 RepID=UPI00313126D1
MSGRIKSTGGRRKEKARAPASEAPSMREGIDPDDRELFALAGIDYSDVPDLPTIISFKDDEPDHFITSITSPQDVELTKPFISAQGNTCSPNQVEAADKAGCGPPLFVYGSSLFPEVLCQQLGVPVDNAMHMANNYIPAIAPYCTRYCLAGEVPLAAMVHNQDAQLNSYLKKPRKEPHVRGALVFGLHEKSKQHIDKCYGAKPKEEGGESTWGPWKRVAIGVRCRLHGWKQPGWVIAETYIWNGSVARLHCFQQDLIWTPHLFADFCQKKRRDAAAKGVEYKGPPLWTAEDVKEWQKRRPAEIEEEEKRKREDVRKIPKKLGGHGTEDVRRQMREAEKRRLKALGTASVNRENGGTSKSQTDKARRSHSAPNKTQNHHQDVGMKDAQEVPKQQAVGAQKKHQRNDKQLNSSPTVC